ncbi:MAG: hypothetical protein R2880_18525 [Deinococcales bacterium]
MMGFIFIACQYLSELSHLPTFWWLALALSLPLYNLLGVLRGESQGRQDYRHLASNFILEAFLKLLLTALFLALICQPGLL